MDKIKQFCKDRDEAILSLNEQKIRAFADDYGIQMPEEEKVFWAGVHKAILHMKAATDEQKWDSMKWLFQHGFWPSMR